MYADPRDSDKKRYTATAAEQDELIARQPEVETILGTRSRQNRARLTRESKMYFPKSRTQNPK